MENDKNEEKLGTVMGYIIKAVKFNDLKNESLTRLIFMITLIAGFGGTYYLNKYNVIDDIQNIALSKLMPYLIAVLFTKIVLTVYMAAFIQQLKGKEFTLNGCIQKILVKLPLLLVYYVVYYVLIAIVGILVIPAILFAVIFLFGSCYIIDIGEGAYSSFEASKNITKGYRKNVFIICTAFEIFMFFGTLIIQILFAEVNVLAYIFVQTFFSAIIGIMKARLVVMLYVDFEYDLDVTGTKNIVS